MNSYPLELLMQLAPVMFVAGLDVPRRPTAPWSGDGDGDKARSPGVELSGQEIPPFAPGMSPTSTSSRRGSISAGQGGMDPFAGLTYRLRDALASQRRPTVWVPEALRRSKTFQVVFVDKAAQFPPRKIPIPDSTSPHSPLSPLTPSSPVYPDGLIAPVWVRKHTSLIPAVYVFFLRLYEHFIPFLSSRPLPDLSGERDHEREERERAEQTHDEELSRKIAERRKMLGERGIKLTVVLLASRRALEDSTLDKRLASIRRSGTLDARASLFVLSPVSNAELAEFVKSLQQTLYEPALEYYTAHSKRVRRKRNRQTQSTSNSHPGSGPGSGAASGTYPHGVIAGMPPTRPMPLRSEGWTVRYEYKMACFAEFRGEDEVALKHYQDAYSTLLLMFGSPVIFVPRTKRWAEAKVLADTMNLKICKLFLYNGEHSLALAQFNTHLRRLCDLSARVWSIEEDTFEYWSWLSKQNRVFAELLEQGTHHALTIPVHQPPSSSQLQQQVLALAHVQQHQQPLQPEVGALRAAGLNPSTALMHPGFYYYAAAGCTERRREQFLAVAQNEAHASGQSPGFQNEKKVDHMANILELYTKAYELFKKYSATPMSPSTSAPSSGPSHFQSRFTLLVAYRIAQTYYESGKHDMSIRFFERIAKTYRKEKWGTLLHPLLKTWYACAEKVGDIDMGVRLLVELIIYGQGFECSAEAIEKDELDPGVGELSKLLNNTIPKSTEPIVIDLAEHQRLLNSSCVFWVPIVGPGEATPFQIHFRAPLKSDIADLPISELRIYSQERQSAPEDSNKASRPLIILKHACPVSEQSGAGNGVEYVDLGHISLSPKDADAHIQQLKETEVNLHWSSGDTLVLAGTISSDVPKELKFTKAVLCILQGSWVIELPLELGLRRDDPISCPKWLSATDPPTFIPVRRSKTSSVMVKARPHQMHISFSHHSPAYLDESYPVSIDIENEDDRALKITIDVLLQPGDDDCVNHMQMDDQRSTSLIKGVRFGLLRPGTVGSKTLYLSSTGTSGDRMVDVSVQSRAVIMHESTSLQVMQDEEESESESESESEVQSDPQHTVAPHSVAMPGELNEILTTLIVSAVAPFITTHDTTYSRRRSQYHYARSTPSLAGDKDKGEGGTSVEQFKGRMGQADLRTFDVRFWDDSVGGQAEVTTTIVYAESTECATAAGARTIVVERIRFMPEEESAHSRLICCSLDDSQFPYEFMPGDPFSITYEFSLAPPDDFFADRDAVLPRPGRLEVEWRRFSPNGTLGTLSTTHIALPLFKPPPEGLVVSTSGAGPGVTATQRDEAGASPITTTIPAYIQSHMHGLIALLDAPPHARLHEPFTITLTVRNVHSARTALPHVALVLASSSSAGGGGVAAAAVEQDVVEGASAMSVAVSVSDKGREPPVTASVAAAAAAGGGAIATSPSFAIAGPRISRLPALIPGAEARVIWRLVPLECGAAVPLPRIRVVDQRRATEEQTQSVLGTSLGLGFGAGAGERAGAGTGTGVGVGAVGAGGADGAQANAYNSMIVPSPLGAGAEEEPVIDVRWDRRRADGSNAWRVDGMDGAAQSQSQLLSPENQFVIAVSPA